MLRGRRYTLDHIRPGYLMKVCQLAFFQTRTPALCASPGCSKIRESLIVDFNTGRGWSEMPKHSPRRIRNEVAYQPRGSSDMSRNIAFIPARLGSVGLRGKNMANLGGKPLVERAISSGLGAKVIDAVFVSSNDRRVLEYAKARGVRSLVRPEQFATSQATMTEVLLDWMRTDSEVSEEDVFCLLQPTSPLRTAEDISAAFADYHANSPDILISVMEVERSFLKCFFQTSRGEVGAVSPRFSPFSNRQSLPELFKPNGAIYICSIGKFLDKGGFPDTNVRLYEMSEKASLDIDSRADLERAQAFLKEEND